MVMDVIANARELPNSEWERDEGERAQDPPHLQQLSSADMDQATELI